jgi:glycosyltransferase involved in cell wall biosynthesis
VTVTQPDVSVIIGAYEAMPYLVECLASVEAQTIGPERIEVIAVDDGSTDGTGECLEEFADRAPMQVTVVRQENSGGPSGPRNVGLGKAAGRYVFFLDADDRLGPEALERMVAMADRAGTDVVLGRVEGVNRSAPKSMCSGSK